MALVSPDKAVKLDIPHEPGEWIRVRPICAEDAEGLELDGDKVRVSIDLVAKLLTEWSYDEPPSREAVARLDLNTYIWLALEMLEASGIRDLAEKKGLIERSLPGRGRVKAPSRRS